MLVDHLPMHLHKAIRGINEVKLKKIMDLMKVRIHFYSDMQKHTYFFTEPDYADSLSEKMQKKLKLPDEAKCTVLAQLKERLGRVEDSRFTADHVNKECSMYLYENRE